MNEMIKRRKRLTEPEAAYFGRQLLQAMIYLHDNLVIHRDLKLGNLFLDRNMNVKVGDLGLATKLESADEKRKTICGTPNYIAPEVIQGDRATRGHSFEVDIWSMGVILYTCLCGKPPYEAKDVKATYQRILANEYSFPRDVSISDSGKNLIRSMLQSKPTDRPTLDEIAVHPFFSEQFIPRSLPSSVTHVAPVWEENEFGEIAMGLSNNKTSSSKSELSTKPGLPRSSSQRRPFGARDVNVVDRNANPERPERKTTAKQGRDVMAGAVTSALSALAGFGGGAGSNSSSSNKSPSTQPAFQVFDETEPEPPKQRSSSHRKSRPVEEDIVSRTAAMTIRTQDASPFHHQSSMNPTPREELATPAVNNPESDAYVLHNMIDRIDAVLDVTSRRSYSHVHPESPSLTAFSRGGPTRWVSRYVDYTSKYGLGFLLNDGR
jgi:serine/threonine protein kinase